MDIKFIPNFLFENKMPKSISDSDTLSFPANSCQCCLQKCQNGLPCLRCPNRVYCPNKATTAVFDFLPLAQPFLNVQVNYQLFIHSVSNCRPSAVDVWAPSSPVKTADRSSWRHLCSEIIPCKLTLNNFVFTCELPSFEVETDSSQTPLGHLPQVFDFLPSAQPLLNVKVNYQLLIHSVPNCRPGAIDGPKMPISCSVCKKRSSWRPQVSARRSFRTHHYSYVMPGEITPKFRYPMWISLVCTLKNVCFQTTLGHLSQVFAFLPPEHPFITVHYWMLIHSY